MIRSWIRYWDQKEHPRTMGLLRLALGLVILVDFLSLGALDLVIPLMGASEAGGWGAEGTLRQGFWLYNLLPETVASAWGIYATLLTASLCFMLGCAPRVAALVLVVLWAQVAMLVPPSDRGIDLLLRNVLWIFVFFPSGRWGSVEAWWTTGSWRGTGAPIPAWPRLFMIAQLVIVYFTAGLQKVGFHWLPMGDFAALYVILQDWAVARADFGFLSLPGLYAVTQVSTMVSVLWELTFPVVLWVHLGKWRGLGAETWQGWAVRHRIDRWWILIGVVFHLGIFLTLQLGIFPWAVLALYLCLIDPDEWPRAIIGDPEVRSG